MNKNQLGKKEWFIHILLQFDLELPFCFILKIVIEP